MQNLKLKATGKRLCIAPDMGVVISKNVNFDRCVFEFDEDWEGLSKTAVFWQDENAYHMLLEQDGSCFIPAEAIKNSGLLYIGVFGTDDTGKILNTNPVFLRVLEGCLKEGVTPPEPTPDIYSQIMAVIKKGGYVINCQRVCLYGNGWDADGCQTVEGLEVTENSVVFVSPTPTYENVENYAECGILCASQGEGNITFLRNSEPAEEVDISVEVVIL